MLGYAWLYMAFSVQNLSGYTPGIHEKSFVLNLNQLVGDVSYKKHVYFLYGWWKRHVWYVWFIDPVIFVLGSLVLKPLAMHSYCLEVPLFSSSQMGVSHEEEPHDQLHAWCLLRRQKQLERCAGGIQILQDTVASNGAFIFEVRFSWRIHGMAILMLVRFVGVFAPEPLSFCDVGLCFESGVVSLLTFGEFIVVSVMLVLWLRFFSWYNKHARLASAFVDFVLRS